MSDSQTPDPNAFWCPKCREHGKYNRKRKSVSTDNGSQTITTLHCKECEAKGGMPFKLRDECLKLAKICLGVSIFLAVAMLVLGVVDEMDYSETVRLVGITPMAGLVVWIYLGCGSKYITWLKWKKWAKGQGWGEQNG